MISYRNTLGGAGGGERGTINIKLFDTETQTQNKKMYSYSKAN